MTERKIIIIGPPGSGKSTLAMQLAEITHLPLFHLDKAYWKEGWTESSAQEFDEALGKILTQSAWIIDGNYNRTLNRRIAACDCVIYLDFSTCRGIRGVKKRYALSAKGWVRSDIASGCVEFYDKEFLKYVRNFNKRYRKNYRAKMNELAREKTVLFARNHRQKRILLQYFSDKYDK